MDYVDTQNNRQIMAERLPTKGATERPDNDIWLQLKSQFA